MRTEFEKTVDGDAVFYWYDITQHIQNIIGEVVSKAFVCVGHIYRDDSEYEIERAENIFESTVCEINRKLQDNSELFFDYYQDVRLIFVNGKTLYISSLEGFSFEKSSR